MFAACEVLGCQELRVGISEAVEAVDLVGEME